MSAIKEARKKQRLDYQHRYVEACIKYNQSKNSGFTELSFSELNQGRCHGIVLEMQWALMNLFGLSPGQIEEIKRNAGYTDADIEGI